MRVLILGGTIFLGRHVVDEALQRGHELTLFTRGKHGTGPMGVEHVAGNRADVMQLRGRSWDAAIDTSGYEPRHVKASYALDIAHYVFVSSCNAYPDWPEQPVNEDSATWQDGEGYGPDKARCERIVLPDGAVVRAGLIVGPHDNVFRLPWWVRRIREGRTCVAAWLENGGETELDDWRVEYRPPRMSAEREAELLRLASSE